MEVLDLNSLTHEKYQQNFKSIRFEIISLERNDPLPYVQYKIEFLEPEKNVLNIKSQVIMRQTH